jgi:hypothetical protein
VLALLALPLTMLAHTAILAHAMITDVWSMLALVGPFGILFGLGSILVIGPIVKAQGERYQHREITPEVKPHTNGTSKVATAVRHQESMPREGEVVAAWRDETRN